MNVENAHELVLMTVTLTARGCFYGERAVSQVSVADRFVGPEFGERLTLFLSGCNKQARATTAPVFASSESITRP